VIWHFFEVWGLLLVAFAAGALLGTLLYMAVAVSPLSAAQVAAADAISSGLGGFRRRAAGGRQGDGYARPSGAGPRATPAPEAYSAPPILLDTVGIEPVHGEVAAIVPVPHPLDAEWEDEQPYPEDGHPELPAQDTADLPSAIPVEWPIPPLSAAPPAPEEREPSPDKESRPELPAMRPLTLPGPRNGVSDNLQRIRGVGQKNEELLNSLGIYHFGQIAAWTPAEARWVAAHLAFPERIERDDWVGQAIILATGGDTGYVKPADRRKGGDEPPVAA